MATNSHEVVRLDQSVAVGVTSAPRVRPLFGLLGVWRLCWRVPAVFLLICGVFVEVLVRRQTPEQGTRAAQRCADRILRVAGVRVFVEGTPDRGPGLIVANHRSYIDVLVLLQATARRFLCKQEVRRWPLIGRIAERAGVVFVDRSNKVSRARSLDAVARALLGGGSLLAFPEGTTTRGPGMRALRPGLFRAAAEHGFSVSPVAIEYADPRDAWVDDATLLGHCLFWLAKPQSTVVLRFGPRLTQHPSAEQLQQQVEKWLRAALHELNA